MLLHTVRAHLAEFGIAAGAGIAQVTRLVGELARGERTELPEIARFTLETLARLVQYLQGRLSEIEKRLASWHYQNDISNRLETIPGVGIVSASALASIVPDPKAFSSGRHFAAWLGLVPRQNSSGSKSRLGRISKHRQGTGSTQGRQTDPGTLWPFRAGSLNFCLRQDQTFARALAVRRKPARVASTAGAGTMRQ